MARSSKVLTLPDLIDEFMEDQAERHAAYHAGQPPAPSALKVYRNHYCERQHRSYRALAGCIWKRSRPAWITGEGPFALLAWCRVLTITLHPTEAAARQAKARIDATGCGGFCSNRHEIVRIERGESGIAG